MKQIQQVQVWKNGVEKQANAFNLILINEVIRIFLLIFFLH